LDFLQGTNKFSAIITDETIVYAIMFSYYQFLELSIKQLVPISSRALGLRQDFDETHKLVKLWMTLRPNLEKLSNKPANMLAYDRIENVVQEFAKYDPDGYAFRYPVSTRKQGQKETLLTLDTVALVEAKEAMQKAYALFSGVIDYIDYLNQSQPC